MSEAEYEDDSFKPVCEVPKNQRRFYVLELANELFQYSCPDNGGPPSISPEQAFTFAEEFVAEAVRRGY